MIKKLLTLLAFFVFCSSTICADEPKPTPPPLPPGEVIILPITPPQKPRSGTNTSDIEAYIESNYLTITFGTSEGLVDISISDVNGMIINEDVYTSSAPITINISNISSYQAPWKIRISTQYGNEYEGWIE